MRHDLDTALDQCLAWLRAGRSMEACLERYPEFAEELRPLLGLAVQVGRVTIPAVPARARAEGHHRMLAAFDKKVAHAAQTHPVVRLAKRLSWTLIPGRPGSLKPAWSPVLAVLLVLVVGTGAVTVASSAFSLPGDALYPVKLASQRLQLALTFDPVTHALLADRYDAQRRQDVQAVLKRGGQATIEFQGTLERMEESLWTVGGLQVALRESTVIVGNPYVGAEVRVGGELPGDGQLVAHWVTIDSETEPLPTTTPEATHTAPPTLTPTRAVTPVPTSTSAPTQTPGEAPTPVPGGIQVQTKEPETSTPELEESPTPSGRPDGPDLRDDDDTPEPSERTHPGETPERRETPEEEEKPAGNGEPGEEEEKPAGNGEPGEEDEEPDEGETPVDHGQPPGDGEPEEEETPVNESGPEHGGTPEPNSTPDDLRG